MGGLRSVAELPAGEEKDIAVQTVLSHLEEVLESPPFKSSQRSRQFLEYVVTHSLEGQADLLKERLIGERIFGRPVNYDTGQDSIVRVKANEVRRRLAQYYDLHPHATLRIELPSGSYVVQFRAVASPVIEPELPAVVPEPIREPHWRRKPILLFVAAAAAILLAGWLFMRSRPAPMTPFEAFWRPFLTNNKTLTICLPSPEVYRINGDERNLLIERFRRRPPTQPLPKLPSVDAINDVRIERETGLFVGLGDARALGLIQSLASAKGRSPEIRMGSETTFTELRSSPSVLIGGVSNRWTMDLIKGHRFTFYNDGRYSIRDNQTGEKFCEKPTSWEQPGLEDCAVVTRIIDSKTGFPLLIAAGLDHFGTLAVGEYLTQPKLLEQALHKAPKNWESKNMQFVFRVEKVRDNVGPAKALMVHTW